MNKTLKALVLVFLGLIIWTGLVYIAFAFLKAEVFIDGTKMNIEAENWITVHSR